MLGALPARAGGKRGLGHESRPREREIAAAGVRERTLSDEYQRQARSEGIPGAVAVLLLVVAIFPMVVEPGG